MGSGRSPTASPNALVLEAVVVAIGSREVAAPSREGVHRLPLLADRPVRFSVLQENAVAEEVLVARQAQLVAGLRVPVTQLHAHGPVKPGIPISITVRDLVALLVNPKVELGLQPCEKPLFLPKRHDCVSFLNI